MKRNKPTRSEREQTPVDDVRRIRERFDREAGGDVHKLAEQTRRRITDQYLRKLGLKPMSPKQKPKRVVAAGL